MSQRLRENTLVDTQAARSPAGRRSQAECCVGQLRNNHLAELQDHRASCCKEEKAESMGPECLAGKTLHKQSLGSHARSLGTQHGIRQCADTHGPVTPDPGMWRQAEV